jgi:rhamnosyltransferase
MGATGADGQLAVGIVIYHPEPDGLMHLVETLACQVDYVFLFRNSPACAPVLADVGSHLVLLGNETNVGLGVAYNRIFAAAQERSMRRVLLFDQDSVPLATHAATLDQRLRDLGDRGLRPAVIGPLPVSGQDRAYKAPRRATRPRMPRLAPQLPVESLGR